IVVAIFTSYVALFVFSHMQRFMGNQWIKIIISIVMGIAMASIHYIGMTAVVFYTTTPIENTSMMDMAGMSSLLITFVIAGAGMLLLISGLIGNLMDRYVDYRLINFNPLTLFPNQRKFETDLQYKRLVGSMAIVYMDNLR